MVVAPCGTRAKGVLLEPTEVRGMQVSCVNSWTLYGKQKWSNLTLELVRTGSIAKSGQAYIVEGGITTEFQNDELPGAHRVYFAPTDSFGNSGRRFPVEIASKEDRQDPQGVIVTCFSKDAGVLSSLNGVVINLIKPDRDPFDSFYDTSGTYAFINLAIYSIASICLAIMFFFLLEHASHYSHTKNESALLKAAIIGTEFLSTLVLTYFGFATNFDRAPNADSFISFELRASAFPVFLGTNLFTTILVYSLLQDAQDKISGNDCKKKHWTTRALLVGSFIPCLFDIWFVAQRRESNLVGMWVFFSGILALLTLAFALAFIRKSLVLSRLIKKHIDPSGRASGSNLYLAQYCDSINRWTMRIGVLSLLAIGLLVWFTFDDSTLYVPRTFMIFRALTMLDRTALSLMQCIICRVPLSRRRKSEFALPKTTLFGSRTTMKRSKHSTKHPSHATASAYSELAHKATTLWRSMRQSMHSTKHLSRVSPSEQFVTS